MITWFRVVVQLRALWLKKRNADPARIVGEG